ncbi:MAG: DUF1501 domain-containing protein [Phycisphaerales bacterium]|nr:DUF1501 domain-containing protein [Phycisphaerales bacterium]
MMNPDTHACPEYRELSRRGFMALTGAGLAAAAIAPACFPRVALAKDYRSSMRDVVIQVYLRGASDGLSMCVPWGDNAYYAARPTLAVPRPDSGQANRCTDLNGFFGLAEPLLPLLPAYQDGKLLIVHATGSHDPSRSHFDAQRFMEVGKPNDPALGTGWLGRHLAGVGPMIQNPLLRGVGIATGLQRTLVGGPQTLPIPNLDTFGLTGFTTSIPSRSSALTSLYTGAAAPLGAAATDTINTIDLLNTIEFAGYVPAGGAVYPSGAFGLALKQSAALIKAQVGVEAIAIDVGGWDTHDQQGNLTGFMAGLMNTLALTLAAFYRDMTTGVAPTFSLVVMSEFGRRVAENGSAGTEHGHGNCMFVMGNCIDGGRVLANWPGLGAGQLFENRDLQVTIDYRDILAEIVSSRMGNPNLASVFPDPAYTPVFRNVLAC